MRNIVLFLIMGTLVTLVLIVACTAVCAGIIILAAKLINTHILAAFPFSVIAGIVLSFFFYGKIMKKLMNKYGLNKRK